MGSYEFLPHTADEKFRVTAKTLEEAFSLSVTAFYEVLLGKTIVEKKQEKTITLQAKQITTLLYDFLNELVFLFDDEDLLLQHVQTVTITKTNEEYSLEAVLIGDVRNSYELQTEIKNMTYSEMEVNFSEEGVELLVVVDI